MNQEIKAEIQEELVKLQDNIDIAKRSYEKVEAERIEKTEIIKGLQEEITNTEKIQKKKEEEMPCKLNEEIEKGVKIGDIVDQIKNSLMQSHDCERELNEKCSENEEKIENIKSEIFKTKEKKSELLAELDNLSKKLKRSLPLQQVIPILCEKCKSNVNEYKPLSNDPETIHEDRDESRMSSNSYTK